MAKYLQKGFTLGEVLLTLFIIGVIAGIGVPIVSHILKDSDTEEFVSNAKILEDSLSMYYKDNGVLSSVESVSTIDEMSRKIILSRLVKEGVTQPEEVLDKLIADGKLKKIDYKQLKEYTKLDKSVKGADYFLFIDIVEEDDLDESYGVYENDIAGYVFSTETRDKTSGVIYSGAHSITKEESDKLQDEIDDLNKEDEEVFKKGMNPYGFKLVDFTNNKNGTVDLRVTWTNRIVDDNKNLDTFKGYTAVDFLITCNLCDKGNEITYDLDKDKSHASTDSNVSVEQKGSSYVMTLKNVEVGNLIMSIQDDKILYAGKDTGKVSKVGYLNDKSEGIDIENEIIKEGEKEEVPVCDTCGIVEVIPDGPIDELYKERQEVETFDANSVTPVFEGLKIKGLSVGDYLVLKEYKKEGNLYTIDKNRIRLFKVTDTNVLIPKNPYLQLDYQKNVKSKFIYVIEAYNPKIVDNSEKQHPDRAVEVLYEQ